MPKKKKPLPYRIVGAYDSETTNLTATGSVCAFPILHQLGIISCTIEDVTRENVEKVTVINLYRNTLDLYACLDEIAANASGYVPVICCHNLSFDMYGLSLWLESKEVKVLAKSQRKPISFAVLNDAGKPSLVLWDTLVFSQQSLEQMGRDCGYQKGVGEWDYTLVRTPATPLTALEIDYAKRDIYTLLAWLGWWIRRNPEIEPHKLGLNVVTKTGVVRERRKKRFYGLKSRGVMMGQHWIAQNKREAPKTDDELYTMQAVTRGGFTFCAEKSASVPYELEGTPYICAAYDATSQHPAQMVSHRYPERFRETGITELEQAFELVRRVSLDYLLEHWHTPFTSAFNACFEFTNLRPNPGSVYEKNGIFPLASARLQKPGNVEENEDNGDRQAHDGNRHELGYCDVAEGAVTRFGKLVSADKCRVYLTELAAWEVTRAYVWDEMHAEHGYITGSFTRPPDYSIVSVMEFYKAKNEFKRAKGEYKRRHTISNAAKLEKLGIPQAVAQGMKEGHIADNEIDLSYLSLKADLNALFGIEASNEYRRDTVLTANGIEYAGGFGIDNAPKTPKAWYQFGQRIVGWSRLAQCCVMELAAPYIDCIVNGDTDSLKFIAEEGKLPELNKALERLAVAIDKGKEVTCKRVKAAYPAKFDKLEGIGHYVLEFTTTEFCAAWNKAYCEKENEHHYFTLAGVPTSNKTDDEGNITMKRLNGLADEMARAGYSFGEICDKLLSYNTTVLDDLTGLNARSFPKWGDVVSMRVTDYLGKTAWVNEPAALALYSMPKTIGSTEFADNRANLECAKRNRPSLDARPKMVGRNGITYTDSINGG